MCLEVGGFRHTTGLFGCHAEKRVKMLDLFLQPPHPCPSRRLQAFFPPVTTFFLAMVESTCFLLAWALSLNYTGRD